MQTWIFIQPREGYLDGVSHTMMDFNSVIHLCNGHFCNFIINNLVRRKC